MVMDLAIFSEPANELEPVPMPRNLPPAETSVFEWTPRVVFTEPLKDEEAVVALTEKMLEMDATTPEDDAISKNASGVTSPSPNLPVDVDEKMANLMPVLSKISISAVNEVPFVNSQSPVTLSASDSDAGPPLPQSSLTYPTDDELEKVKWDASN